MVLTNNATAMKNIFLLMSIVLLTAADISQKNHIQGHWQWIKSISTNRILKKTDVKTPKSSKQEILLAISEKEIQISKNGQAEAIYAYLHYKDESGLQILRVATPIDQSFFQLSSGPLTFNGDTMIIAGAYNDAGEDQYFLRTKAPNPQTK